VTGFLFLARGEREAACGRFCAYTNVCSPLAPGNDPQSAPDSRRSTGSTDPFRPFECRSRTSASGVSQRRTGLKVRHQLGKRRRDCAVCGARATAAARRSAVGARSCIVGSRDRAAAHRRARTARVRGGTHRWRGEHPLGRTRRQAARHPLRCLAGVCVSQRRAQPHGLRHRAARGRRRGVQSRRRSSRLGRVGRCDDGGRGGAVTLLQSTFLRIRSQQAAQFG